MASDLCVIKGSVNTCDVVLVLLALFLKSLPGFKREQICLSYSCMQTGGMKCIWYRLRLVHLSWMYGINFSVGSQVSCIVWMVLSWHACLIIFPFLWLCYDLNNAYLSLKWFCTVSSFSSCCDFYVYIWVHSVCSLLFLRLTLLSFRSTLLDIY